jgi:replicative DNA helicase Mcm
LSKDEETKHAQKIKKFFNSYCLNDILELATYYPDEKSLYINFINIEKFDRDLAKKLLDNPGEIIPEFECNLREFDLPIYKKFQDVHVRILNVPSRVAIGELRSNHLGKLISIEGMVRKSTEVRPRVTKAAFQCLRCGYITYVEQNSFKFEEPFAGCENETCGKKGPFKLRMEESTFVDAQKLQIQEPPEDLRGTQAQSLDVDAENDLTGMLIPGERVILTGILKSRQRTLRDGKSPYYDLFLDVNSIERMGTAFDEIEITLEDEEKIIALANDPTVYDKVIASIAPLIYGLEDVKEATILQLFSGVPKTAPDGSYLRGDIHILCVGDPSKAKTKLMKSSQARSPRAVFTSGKATTAGGLTAIVTKDEKFGEGRWTVEGGALVMADKGVAFVDEADKMRQGDRDALHEAMEQQEINLAKAGIIATLKTRTAVFMASNPKYGKFDQYEGLADQINMPPSLLSRFDLIFVLLDTPNEVEDARVSEHVLGTHTAGEMQQQREMVSESAVTKEELTKASAHARPEISPELFRKHVAYARRHIFPVMDTEAMSHIHCFYLELRKAGHQSKTKSIPITTRQEEAMVRLAEASARVRLSQRVTIDDAKRATRLMLNCLRTVGIDPQTGEIDASVLNSGVSKSQRDLIRMVREVLQERSKKYTTGKVPIQDLYNEAEQHGFQKERVDFTLKKMASKGDVLMWGKEHVKLMI